MDRPADFFARAEAMVPAWLWPWLVVGVGVAAALWLHGMIWRGLERLTSGRSGLVPRVLPRLKRPGRLMILVLAAVVLLAASDFTDRWETALVHIAAAFVIIILGWVSVIVLDVAVERFTMKLALDAEDNLTARKQVTQMRLLQRAGRILIVLLTVASVLATFETVRQYGVSLFASAGAAGLVLGFAARPVLANLIAGIQIALTQPIRIDDVVIVEEEWGWIEEIASTYVVVRIWDLRRLIVPLSQFIEQPFQNWTRENANIIGSVYWYLDYTAPIGEMRKKLQELVSLSPHWDGKVANLQVVETDKDVIHVRGLMSARNSPIAWDLRCEVREKMIDWLQAEHPSALPRLRGEFSAEGRPRGIPATGPGPGADGSGVPEEALPPGDTGPQPDT